AIGRDPADDDIRVDGYGGPPSRWRRPRRRPPPRSRGPSRGQRWPSPPGARPRRRSGPIWPGFRSPHHIIGGGPRFLADPDRKTGNGSMSDRSGGLSVGRAPFTRMARRLDGDLGEEVTDDTLFPRSPTADRRDGPSP